MAFDYGAEKVEAQTRSFKNPKVGSAPAVLRSIIHLGMFVDEYQGKKKDPAPYVVFIFELKRKSDFEEDNETPLAISKAIPLRGGDKSWLTKIESVFMQDGDTSMGDWIDRPCQLNLTGGKDLNEDKTPKFVKIAGITAQDEDTLEMRNDAGLNDIKVKGSGHVKFADLTKEAIEELHPIIEVAEILMKGETYQGSQAQAVIAEIRKENPDFAKRKASDKKPETGGQDEPEQTTATPPPQLDDDEEF